MAAPKGGSRERLLDAAEQLFAEKGYDAASTREITASAGDTLGTFSYHFKSKEALLANVITRRFDELNEHRRNMYLEFTCNNGGKAPSLQDTVTAIVLPLVRLAMCGSLGWRRYIILLCRLTYVGKQDHYKIMAELTDPVGEELLGWLSAAAPGVPAVNVGYAYQFIIGCMLDSLAQSKGDRLARISRGAASGADFPELSRRILAFVIAGAGAVLSSQE